MTTDTQRARMSDAEIAAKRERAEAATPGPWHHFHMPLGMADRIINAADTYYVAQDVASWDAAFIAAARTDIPALCDELAAERAILTRLHNARNSADFAIVQQQATVHLRGSTPEPDAGDADREC